MKLGATITGVAVAFAAVAYVSACAFQQKPEKKYEVTHTISEWKKLLGMKVYKVLRNADTEPAWSGTLLNVHDKGTFVCAGCGQKLFRSETKFESGTGWPSFWDPITPKAIEKVEDLSDDMTRTEVKCSKCGGHLGHVFDDGPQPTGLRYCMNSVAMKFVPDPKK